MNVVVIGVFIALIILWAVILGLRLLGDNLVDSFRVKPKDEAIEPHSSNRLILSKIRDRDFIGVARLLFIGLVIFIIVILAVIRSNEGAPPFAGLDSYLAELMYANWHAFIIRFATFISNLANTNSIVIFLMAAEVYLLLCGRYALALGLVIACAADVITVTAVKELVARPRLLGGFYIESTYSFPSGHSGISTAFFVTLGYILWRVRLMPLYLSIGLFASLAVLIGSIRMYLLEHYLTDVVTGWLIGLFWMGIGLSLAEHWMQHKDMDGRAHYPKLAGVIALALTVVGLYYSYQYSPPERFNLNPPQHKTITETFLNDYHQVIGEPTQRVTGVNRPELNTVLCVENVHMLMKQLSASDWTLAKSIGVNALRDSIISNKADDTNSVILSPYFYEGEPNRYGWYQEASNYQLRLWDSGYKALDNRIIFLGVLSKIIAEEQFSFAPKKPMNEITEEEQAIFIDNESGVDTSCISR